MKIQVGVPLISPLVQHNVQSVAVEGFVDGKGNWPGDLFAPKFLGMDSKPSKGCIDDRSGDHSSCAMFFDGKLVDLFVNQVLMGGRGWFRNPFLCDCRGWLFRMP